MIEMAVMCLALNIYHEARGEPVVGQKAVAEVTMNRAGWNPANVCAEVFRPYQFSWANPLTTVSPEERRRRADAFMPQQGKAWDTAKKVARRAVTGKLRPVVRGADHYHATYVSPRWARKMTRVAQIGRHVFYKGG